MNEARNAMHELLLGATKSYITYCVAKLDIVDYLNEKCMTAEELSLLTSTDKELLYRLLRAAVSIGLLVENKDNQFSVTDLGLTLKTGGEYCMKNAALVYCGHSENPVSKLPELLQNSTIRENRGNEMSIFQKIESQPDIREKVHGSIKEFSDWAKTKFLVSGYDYSKFKYIVDVGGATGTFLIDILTKTPESHGTVVDFPSIVDLAKKEIDRSCVKERCTAVTGDFFSALHVDGDCYILKYVLHDWNDENALKILRTVRKSMKNKSTLLVMDMIKPEGTDPNPVDVFDIWFLCLISGKERSKSDFENLFEKASLKIKNVIEINPCRLKIIEVKPC